MTHDSLRSQLEPLAAIGREPDPAEVKRLAERAWHERNLLVVDKSWIDKSLHTLVDGIGTAAHGKRKHRP